MARESFEEYMKKYIGDKVLIGAAHYGDTEIFNRELEKLNPTEVVNELLEKDSLGQNILHIAMKNIAIFKTCCSKLDPEKIAALITQTYYCDKKRTSNNTVLHSLVVFGCSEALNHLLSLAKTSSIIDDALQFASKKTNSLEEKPSDIIRLGALSKTLIFVNNDEKVFAGAEITERVLASHHQMVETNLFRNEAIYVLLAALERNVNSIPELKNKEKKFRNNALALQKKIQNEFERLKQHEGNSLKPEVTKAFVDFCKTAIEEDKPKLDKTAIGKFMRFFNKLLASVFNCRKEAHMLGQAQQRFFGAAKDIINIKEQPTEASTAGIGK